MRKTPMKTKATLTISMTNADKKILKEGKC